VHELKNLAVKLCILGQPTAPRSGGLPYGKLHKEQLHFLTGRQTFIGLNERHFWLQNSALCTVRNAKFSH